MKLLLAIIWTSPFILLSYLAGVVVAARLKHSEAMPDVPTSILFALLVFAGVRNIVAVVSMVFGGTPGRVDWFLIAWLLLLCVLAGAVGDNYRREAPRTVELNIGKWLSVSISALAILFAALVVTGGTLEIVDLFPRPAADYKTPAVPWRSWLRAAASHVPVFGNPGKKKNDEAALKADLRRQERLKKEALRRYLATSKRPEKEEAPDKEPEYDPAAFSGWSLEPIDLAPVQVAGYERVSATNIGDNIYEIVFEPTGGTGGDEEGHGGYVSVVLVISKHDAPQVAREYLEPVSAQFAFAPGTVSVDGAAAKLGFYGGMLGKRPVYQQALIGWTTSLFAFEVVSRTQSGAVTDKTLLVSPALAVAGVTRRNADPAVARNVPAK